MEILSILIIAVVVPFAVVIGIGAGLLLFKIIIKIVEDYNLIR